MFNFLIKYRFHIMWTYIALVILLLTAPLPFEEGYGTGKTASVSHFLMFFLLGMIVEFAHLFLFDKIRLARLLVFAIIMETIQLALPYRVFDINDVGMNVVGVIISYLVIILILQKKSSDRRSLAPKEQGSSGSDRSIQNH